MNSEATRDNLYNSDQVDTIEVYTVTNLNKQINIARSDGACLHNSPSPSP